MDQAEAARRNTILNRCVFRACSMNRWLHELATLCGEKARTSPALNALGLWPMPHSVAPEDKSTKQNLNHGEWQVQSRTVSVCSECLGGNDATKRPHEPEYTPEHARGGVHAELPEIETWENEYHGQRDLAITIPEFTCICPKTGLPDFGTITDPLSSRQALPGIEVAEVLHRSFPQPWNVQ